MMDDRTLLERAAKAAGVFLTREKLAAALPKWEWSESFEPHHDEDGGMCGTFIWYGSDGVEIGGTDEFHWDPLNDDGDALRLAVALGLVVDCSRPSAGEPFKLFHFGQDGADDLNAATRRAIVRAAAEIGGE